MSTDGKKHLTLRFLAELDFSRYNNDDIDCYVNMSKDPPLVDPKAEIPLKL